MRKTIFSGMLAATALVFAAQTSNAQSGNTNVTVNVTLDDVMSTGGGTKDDDGNPIEGTGTASGDNVVDFHFNDLERYTSPYRVPKLNQINVLSTVAYKLFVKSDSPSFVGDDHSSNLDLDILSISIKKGDETAYTNEGALTTTPRVLVQGESALKQPYDIQYTIAPNEALVTAKKQKYTASIIFSLSGI